MFFRRRKVFTVIIIVMISITMLGSGFVTLFSIPERDTGANAERKSMEQEYERRRQAAGDIAQNLEADPGNRALQSALADAWLDVYISADTLGRAEADDALDKALVLYAELAEDGEDTAVWLSYATAAFYRQDYTLAGGLLTELLAREPENVEAMTVYGACLFYGQADYAQAETVWRNALALARDDAERDALAYYAGMARAAKEASGETADENDG
jgi:cytochrome c-type biogenesis protein CcmH/NrfG